MRLPGDRRTRRTFLLLVGAGLLGVLAVLPYQFALVGWPSRELLALVVALALVQNAVLIGLAVGIGLTLGRRVGLAVRRDAAEPLARYARAALIGAGVGGATLVLDLVAFLPLVREAVLGGPVVGGVGTPTELPALEAAGLGLLASLYGGITEELLLRFGLLSLLVWAGWRLTGRPEAPGDRVVWAAIVLTALLFAVGHLGATAALFELTPAVLARMLVLNGLAGVVFGWLYWRWDLLSAIVAHFAADVVLHVLAVSLA